MPFFNGAKRRSNIYSPKWSYCFTRASLPSHGHGDGPQGDDLVLVELDVLGWGGDAHVRRGGVAAADGVIDVGESELVELTALADGEELGEDGGDLALDLRVVGDVVGGDDMSENPFRKPP